jgi:hypothetical protein
MLTRRLAAPSTRVEDEQTPDAIRLRLARGPGKSALRDFVYGGVA